MLMEPGGSPLLLAPPTTPWIASKFLGTAERLSSPLSSLETAYLAHLMVFPIRPPGVRLLQSRRRGALEHNTLCSGLSNVCHQKQVTTC